MDSYLLQPWATISLNPSLSAFNQDADASLDLGPFSDGAFWIDASNVVAGGGSPTLAIQTSPSLDEAYFTAISAPLVLSSLSSSTPVVIRPTTTPLARYVRWQLNSGGASSAWGATFRIRALVSKQSAFLPSSISGCTLWLRGDLGITLNGTLVSAWADQSASGANATQGTSTLQPTFIAADSVYGGQATLLFNGSYISTPMTKPPWQTPTTVFFVGHGTLSNVDFVFGISESGLTQLQLYDVSSLNVTVANGTQSLASGVGTLNTPSIVYATISATSCALAVRQFTPQVIGNIGSASNTGMTIGLRMNQPSWGTIAEVALYNSVLSTAQIRMMTRYLAKRYNLLIGP
jgi:hypothetical protein